MKDVLLIPSSEEFEKIVDINPDLDYHVNIDVLEDIWRVINRIIALSDNRFLGISVLPQGENAVIKMRLCHIGGVYIDMDDVKEDFECVSKLSLIPLSKDFIMELEVENLYTAQPFEECGFD